MQEHVRRMIGAVLGGAAGFGAYWLLGSVGIYALVIVGGGLAWGVEAASTRRSIPWAIVTPILVVALSLFAEWFTRPFTADPSFGYFVRNLGSLSIVTWIMIAIAAAFGVWSGLGRDRVDLGPREWAAFCGKCGADLRESTARTCPECGEPRGSTRAA